MPVQTYRTVLDVVRDACRQLSILVPAGVYDSEDENAQLMGSLVNNIGAMLLANRRCFQQFRKFWTITGDGTRRAWDVPSDYGRLINDTGWSHAMFRPCHLVGPDQWATLIAQRLAVTITPVFRLMGDQFVFMAPPMNGEQISFEYVTNQWVIDGEDNSKRKQFCTVNNDRPMFDSVLMTLALKVQWRNAKGFDSAAATDDFNERYNQVFDADIPGETLRLGGGLPIGVPLISPFNTPQTGFGS